MVNALVRPYGHSVQPVPRAFRIRIHPYDHIIEALVMVVNSLFPVPWFFVYFYHIDHYFLYIAPISHWNGRKMAQKNNQEEAANGSLLPAV